MKKKVRIKFIKIDMFCRPVFLAVDLKRRMYLCDTDNLFSLHAKEKEVLEFYANHPNALQRLTTKDGGSEGEPTGNEYHYIEFELVKRQN